MHFIMLSFMFSKLLGIVVVVVIMIMHVMVVTVALRVGSMCGSCHDGRSMRGSSSGNDVGGNGSASANHKATKEIILST
jgi:hypothetical protein